MSENVGNRLDTNTNTEYPVYNVDTDSSVTVICLNKTESLELAQSQNKYALRQITFL